MGLLLVNFIVRDVIARHFFKVDSSFYPLFKVTDGGTGHGIL